MFFPPASRLGSTTPRPAASGPLAGDAADLGLTPGRPTGSSQASTQPGYFQRGPEAVLARSAPGLRPTVSIAARCPPIDGYSPRSRVSLLRPPRGVAKPSLDWKVGGGHIKILHQAPPWACFRSYRLRKHQGSVAEYDGPLFSCLSRRAESSAKSGCSSCAYVACSRGGHPIPVVLHRNRRPGHRARPAAICTLIL